MTPNLESSHVINSYPTCAVAGDKEDWTATSRPSWDDLTRFTWLQSSPSSTLLVQMEVGTRQMEAVGARNEWRFTSTRWQELYSRSDFCNSFLCLLHSLSDLTLSGLNVKIFGNFFSKWGWFLAEQPLTSEICELNTTVTETKRDYPHCHFLICILPINICNVSMIVSDTHKFDLNPATEDTQLMTTPTPNYHPAVSLPDVRHLTWDQWPVLPSHQLILHPN